MSATEKKRRAAEAAIPYIEPGMVLGVGTGSTVAQLIEVLKDRKIQLEGAVSSSAQDVRRAQGRRHSGDWISMPKAISTSTSTAPTKRPRAAC